MTKPENDPGAKFQLRSLGELRHPGQCLACGSGNRTEGYIDLATYFDYEGQMYLCMYCMEEAGGVAGMLSEVEADALNLANLKLLTELNEVKDRLAHAERRLAGIDQYLNPLNSAVRNVLVGETTDRKPEGALDDLISVVSGPAGGESEPAKSVKKSGSNDTARTSVRDLKSDGLDL